MTLCAACLTGCGGGSKSHDLDGVSFPVTFDEETVSTQAAEKIAGFYQSVQDKNGEAYSGLLCNEFLAYSELYWKQNGYTADDLVKDYYTDLAAYASGDFTVTGVEIMGVDYDDGAQKVIEALDTVSQQVWDKKASSYWNSCKRVHCNVTLKSIADGKTYVRPENRVFLIAYSDIEAIAVFDDV